jgi:hypothetical protein
MWQLEKLNGANMLKRLILKKAFTESGLRD